MFFKQFVCGGAEKVKRTTLINWYDKGCLKKISLKDFFDSLKMNWFQKLNGPPKKYLNGRIFHYFVLRKAHLFIRYD